MTAGLGEVGVPGDLDKSSTKAYLKSVRERLGREEVVIVSTAKP